MRGKFLMTVMTVFTLSAGTIAAMDTAFAQSSDQGQEGCKQGQSANCVPGPASDPNSPSPNGTSPSTTGSGSSGMGTSGTSGDTNTSPGGGTNSGGSNGSNGSGN
jgi:hypothetical protein